MENNTKRKSPTPIIIKYFFKWLLFLGILLALLIGLFLLIKKTTNQPILGKGLKKYQVLIYLNGLDENDYFFSFLWLWLVDFFIIIHFES